MNELVKRILDTNTPKGTASLWWLGQMGLIVKMGDTVLSIDYYATPDPSRQTEPPVPVGELEGISAFLGTHDHLDHIDHEAWRIWAKTNQMAKFVFPRKHMESVLADGISVDNALGLNDGEKIKVGDVTITAVAAAHEFLEQDPETMLYPHLQYIIEGNGVRIHHAGDTIRYEGMLGKVKACGKIDAQLLPINGRDSVRYRRNCIGNMTYQEAADFAGDCGTGLVIPGHWDMFADNSADPKEFCDYIEIKYGDKLKSLIPKVMEQIVVKV